MDNNDYKKTIDNLVDNKNSDMHKTVTNQSYNLDKLISKQQLYNNIIKNLNQIGVVKC